MRRLFRILRAIAIILIAFAAIAFVLNTNLLATPPDARPLVIAHRGLGQTFHRENITGDTCTATRLLPVEHPYLENTIAGMQAAFDAGADIVEFDVHPTTDNHFVVFHDWTLDCRTDGHGVTREQDLATLKALDIGYGYTADDGQTFPFRGKGVGLMPTLDEVLAAFPDRRFLINIKSNDASEGDRLAAVIGKLGPDQRALISVYGGGRAVEIFHAALPDVTVLGTDSAKRCLLTYALLGWTTYVPESCRRSLFMLPTNIAPWAWGYPNRLTERLAAVGTRVVLLGPYDGSGFSSGIDSLAELDAVPARFDGAIWTNRVDRIGPAVEKR